MANENIEQPGIRKANYYASALSRGIVIYRLMGEINLGGRPPLFETDEQLLLKVDEYFKWIEGEYQDTLNEETKIKQRIWIRHPEPPTITGLALYLGFESRQSFYDYEERDGFSYTIKRARMRIENQYEKNLSGNNCTGSIFALKNLGWKDKTEVDNRYPEGVQVVMKNANTIETK